jgi:hypothetical protein
MDPETPKLPPVAFPPRGPTSNPER